MKILNKRTFVIGLIIGLVTGGLIGYFGYIQGFNSSMKDRRSLEKSIVSDDICNLNEEHTRQLLKVQEMYYRGNVESDDSNYKITYKVNNIDSSVDSLIKEWGSAEIIKGDSIYVLSKTDKLGGVFKPNISKVSSGENVWSEPFLDAYLFYPTND